MGPGSLIIQLIGSTLLLIKRLPISNLTLSHIAQQPLASDQRHRLGTGSRLVSEESLSFCDQDHIRISATGSFSSLMLGRQSEIPNSKKIGSEMVN